MHFDLIQPAFRSTSPYATESAFEMRDGLQQEVRAALAKPGYRMYVFRGDLSGSPEGCPKRASWKLAQAAFRSTILLPRGLLARNNFRIARYPGTTAPALMTGLDGICPVHEITGLPDLR